MGQWKSVRISDAIYALAEQASASSCRSLSQQIEHWTRLGATLDAAGITAPQVARLLLGDAKAIDGTLAQLGLSPSAAMESEAITAKNAKLEDEVRHGRRAAGSLVHVPRALARNARAIYPKNPFGKPSGW